ncbi:hypothetical protein EDB83DRAFT_1771751 [Lactarius deliciosus]|nr:hypothetical protein EDB83DRAFT_1771751 [Lactarius deliciosus]
MRRERARAHGAAAGPRTCVPLRAVSRFWENLVAFLRARSHGTYNLYSQCTTSSVVYLRRMNRRALVARSQSGLHLETLDVGCSSRISVAAAVYVSAELVNALSGFERCRKGVCAAREPARMWLGRYGRCAKGLPMWNALSSWLARGTRAHGRAS